MPQKVQNSNEKHWSELQISPHIPISLSKTYQVCPPHVTLLIFLGNLTGNFCLEPPSCHTRFDTLTWCCKHSFYLDLYLSFDLVYVLLPIECMLLIAVFSCLKRAFVSDFIFILQVSFFFFYEHMTDAFSVKLSCVRCVDIIHSLTSVLYLVRLVFLMPTMVGNSLILFVKLCLRVWCFAD